jgi:Protein of unknown function (DUF2934)
VIPGSENNVVSDDDNSPGTQDEPSPSPENQTGIASSYGSATSPPPEEIAAEAFAIYESRGGEHGRHDDDWFEAERRLLERQRNQGA